MPNLSTFIAFLFIGLALLLAILATTYSSWYSLEVDRHAGTRKRLKKTAALLDESRGREQALQDRLDDVENRLRLATDLLAEHQRRGFAHVDLAYPAEHIFPDLYELARSLGDEVEAWLAGNPSSED